MGDDLGAEPEPVAILVLCASFVLGNATSIWVRAAMSPRYLSEDISSVHSWPVNSSDGGYKAMFVPNFFRD